MLFEIALPNTFCTQVKPNLVLYTEFFLFLLFSSNIVELVLFVILYHWLISHRFTLLYCSLKKLTKPKMAKSMTPCDVMSNKRFYVLLYFKCLLWNQIKIYGKKMSNKRYVILWSRQGLSIKCNFEMSFYIENPGNGMACSLMN